MSVSALVVDDDDFVRNAVVRQLSGLGVDRVESACDGEQAVQTLGSKGPFDVVVLDLQMPGTDGIEFIRRIGATRTRADVILTSSLDRKILDGATTLARAHQLRVLGTLCKPITTQGLADLLKNRRPTSSRESAHQMDASPPIAAESLSQALDRREIIPWYQPLVDCRSGRLEAVEALARWRKPDGSLIPPIQFIDLAETAGLMDRLTSAVAHAALAEISAWANPHLRPTIGINISANSLLQLALPDELTRLAADAGMAPNQLMLEITEAALVDNLKVSLDTLMRMRLKGFGLALDDFGTGYATLAQLTQIPANELKIDQQFVRRAGSDASARAIVRSCISLAKDFELKTVAEGVETAEDAQLMREMGVDLLQGYYIGRPMPVDALREWWRGRHH